MADKPVTREEKYLAYLTGEYTGELPKPITRKEKYLYELCLKRIGGEISPEEIKNAVNEYLEKNPVKPGATTEQAQQIEQNKTDIGSLKTETNSLKGDLSQLSEEKVDLPKDAIGNLLTPSEGQTLLFRADGTTYYGTPSSTGGGDSGTGTTVHRIVWDLVNVTSSENIVSIADGSPLVAVLTPSDGYSLGDVTVTMGGEALTGVWNTDTSTVAIASVTGDVIVSCYGVKLGKADTTVEIAEEGYVWQSASTSNMVTKQARAGMGISKKYTFTPMREKLSALGIVSDDGNINSPINRKNYTPKIKMCQSKTNYLANGNVDSGHTRYTKVVNMKDDEPLAYGTGSYDGTEKSIEVFNATPSSYNTASVDGNALVFDIFIDDVDTSYAYWTSVADTALFPDGVNKGDIIFAGKDTPYYGMKNIDGTMLDGSSSSGVLSLDDDIAMDYGIATTSIMGEEVATDPQTVYGLSSSFASIIDEARKAWMEEYKGDFRKIPIIVSTDQHGRRNNGIFNMLGKVLNMHDVSKVMNLGDTTSTWYDADTTKPLLTDATLDAWLESIKEIPYSKRLDVFGNHDTWYGNYEDEGNVIGTRYPSSQAHLNQYFRNIYARRTNNNGWFVTYDNHFNVKYVVVSAFEYRGTVTFRIGTEQMTWLIEELSKNDGYDVVIVSHVPLLDDPTQNIYPTGQTSTKIYRVSELDTDAFFSARKTKGNGTIVDSDGVSHDYDFTACESSLLCSLHGHTHYDAYLYLNNSLLVNAFDWFDDNTFFFVLIDRVNNQLNVWKVDGTPQFINYQIPLDKPTE